MTSDPIRYLHLSDFHVGKDAWAQRRLFDKIIGHVADQKKAGFIPDLIFITGDVANRGAKSEYETFRREFYTPLTDVLEGTAWSGLIFGVPGNHDIARPTNDVLNQAAATSAGSRFFDPTREGRTARDQVLPRFKQYKQLMPGNVSSDWIASPSGAFSELLDIRGQLIAIAGVNTAWLSMNDRDKGKLTPGVPLVETSLIKGSKCHVQILLGHHPLSWFHEDEATRLRAIFGHNKVIYLHGHMHRPEARREDGAGEGFLVFQSGAAFQARDDEIWKNGLTWGEVDYANSQLRLSPRFWNPDNYDWPVETGRFPERLRLPASDWWAWILPRTPPSIVSSAPPWEPPSGWVIVDSTFLDAHRRDITQDEAAHFFDGAEPDWSVAQSPLLPQRDVVRKLTARITEFRGLERPQVTLLIGPGGEGKSTAMRQVVVNLVQALPKMRVLWRRNEAEPITPNQIMALPHTEAGWLVVSDAADMIASSLHASTQALRGTGRSDIRFLLSARDSDWRAGGATRLDWRLHAEFHDELLSGLSLEDAKRITSAWAAFGAPGLGQAPTSNPESLAVELRNAAHGDASVGEGALLGGMLAIRMGTGLRGHVKSLMDKLGTERLPSGGTLYTAFSYIAVMHSEGLHFLSRPVLAQALQCSLQDLQKNVVFGLGREAAGGGGTVLLTRHRRIAKAAVEIMADDYGEDVDRYFVELAKAAMLARRDSWIPEIRPWQYDLPQHFLKQRPDLAIRIGQAMSEVFPADTHLAVNLARLHRESKNPVAGAEVLRNFGLPRKGQRKFWFEWATCAGVAGETTLNVLLAAWSVADLAGIEQPDDETAKASMAGLGMAFAELYRQHHDKELVAAQGAAGQIGLTLRLDPTTRRYCEGHLKDAQACGVVQTDLNGAFARIEAGIAKAMKIHENQFGQAAPIPVPRQMAFTGLRRIALAHGAQ